MVTYTQVSISTTATQIVASNTNRKVLIIRNAGTETVYIGSDSSVVSTANNANGGYPIISGEEFVNNDYVGAIYGITASGTSTCEVFEEDLS